MRRSISPRHHIDQYYRAQISDSTSVLCCIPSMARYFFVVFELVISHDFSNGQPPLPNVHHFSSTKNTHRWLCVHLLLLFHTGNIAFVYVSNFSKFVHDKLFSSFYKSYSFLAFAYTLAHHVLCAWWVGATWSIDARCCGATPVLATRRTVWWSDGISRGLMLGGVERR